MELDKTKLLAAIDRAKAANDMDAVNRMMAQIPDPANVQNNRIDKKSGAGLGTRAVVGNAKSPVDRLASMRNHYPEAQPYGEDNFIYYNREDGRPTLYNPPGLMPELGDFAEYGRVGTEITAGVGAGILASPTTPAGSIAVGGTAATAAGALYDQAINQFGGADSRDLGKMASDTAIEFGMNMIPFDKGLGMAKDFISPKFRAMMTNANQAVIDVANKYNINATAGVLGNRFMQGVDAATQKVLGGVDAWEKSAADMMEGVGRMIDDFHVSLGGKSNPEAAGQQLVNQAKKYVDNFQTTSEELYKQVDKFIPESARVPALKTRDFLAAYRDRFANDPEIAKILRDPKIGALADATGQNMDYSTIRSLRTMIGGKIKDRDTIGDLSQSDLKQLYAALTDDLFEGAADFGEEALKAMTDANDFYRAGSVVMEDVVEKHFMTTGKWSTASEAFSSIKKVVNDPEKLRSMQASGILEEGDFNQVGSAILDDVGLATKGNQNATAERLSPSRIIAQTDNSVIPPGSQDILFNGTAKEIMADMRVFGEAVQGVEGLVNRSNSGLTVQAGGLGVSLGNIFSGDPIAGMAAFVGSLAVPYFTAKGMSSQWLKDWMRNAPKEGGKKAMAQWKKDGARLAAAQGVAPFFQAMLDLSDENTSSRGALEE